MSASSAARQGIGLAHARLRDSSNFSLEKTKHNTERHTVASNTVGSLHLGSVSPNTVNRHHLRSR